MRQTSMGNKSANNFIIDNTCHNSNHNNYIICSHFVTINKVKYYMNGTDIYMYMTKNNMTIPEHFRKYEKYDPNYNRYV
jgi:hypothetical protein